MLDCGMHPEHVGHDATPMLEELEDLQIRSTILTHAHQDHVGCLPLLQSRQHGMPVLMTQGTARIADIMLHNSVNVMIRQQEELKLQDYPLFGHRGIELASRTWRTCPMDRPLTLDGERAPDRNDSTTVSFHDAGHILGSAGVMIRSEGKSFFYTGDVNFEDQTIQTGARFPEEPVDILLMETTRGDAPLAEGFTRAKEEERFAKAVAVALKGVADMVLHRQWKNHIEILAKKLAHLELIIIPSHSVKFTGIPIFKHETVWFRARQLLRFRLPGLMMKNHLLQLRRGDDRKTIQFNGLPAFGDHGQFMNA